MNLEERRMTSIHHYEKYPSVKYLWLLNVKHLLLPLMFVDIYTDSRIIENQSLLYVLKNLKMKVILR